ncbi:MAG: twin-arginine translocase subunit TatC, partial [Candidatus Korarchaeota archaeon]|nr:twin-arginine translocase subunit TatC [Candidatus Korarchaeota archaeon]
MSGEEKPLLQHLEELVYRLRRILLAVGVAAIVLSAIPIETQSYTPLITVFPSMLLSHLVPREVSFLGAHYNITLCQFKPFSGFDILIKTAVLLGVLGASPIIVHEIYAYIAPALYPHEARALRRLSVAGLLLFLLGVLVAYFLVIPVALRMMFILLVAVSPP